MHRELANHIKSSVVLKVVMPGSIAYKNKLLILHCLKLKDMKKEKLKLKVGDSVICYDGATMMSTSTVTSVDKEKGTATLKNGIICKRESKENNFKRADYMAKSFTGFVKLLNEETQELYDVWIFKQGFTNIMEDFTKKVSQKFNLTHPELKALAFRENQELYDYILKAKRSIEKLKEKLV